MPQPYFGLLVERLQIANLERLDEDRIILAVIAIFLQQFEQLAAMAQTQSLEIAWMFGFRIDADPLAAFFRMGAQQLQHFFEGRHFEPAIILHIRSPQFGKPFPGAQCFQLGEGKIFGEPAGIFLPVNDLAGPARRKFRPVRHIRGLANLVLVPGDQHAVLGQHKIGFDVIRTLFDSQLIGGQRMFRTLAAGTAVRNDYRRFSGQCLDVHAGFSGRFGLRAASGQNQRQYHYRSKPHTHQPTSTPFQNAIRPAISAAASLGSG